MNMTDDEEGNDDDNSYGGPAEYFAVGRLRQLIGVELLEPRSQPATQITAIMISSFESGIQTGW